MRYLCEISYTGTDYHGWQKQTNAITIQSVVEEKLTVFLGESIEIIGSSRTDTGVHGEQQFFHVDISGEVIKKDFLRITRILSPR